MNDQAIEQEIQAKGLNAPRVTLADLKANIVDTEIVKHVSKTGQVLRWAILTTRNGFAVVGKHSASVSSANDDAKIGEDVAVDNSIDVLWQLMGYALKDQLHRRAQLAAEPKTSDEARMQKHGDMVRESGWKVNYGDGQQHNETVSRGPAQQERPRQLPAASLPPHQKRVIDEKRELDERKEKLEAFFDTPTFAQLDADEQGRLHAQRGAMAAYARILSERISAFASDDAVLDAGSSR